MEHEPENRESGKAVAILLAAFIAALFIFRKWILHAIFP